MGLFWINRFVTGPLADRPAFNDPRIGASIDAEVLHLDSDTGDLSVSNGQRWTAVGSISGGGASTLASLSDVTLASPADTEVLAYDGTAHRWENKPAPGYPGVTSDGADGLTVAGGETVERGLILGEASIGAAYLSASGLANAAPGVNNGTAPLRVQASAVIARSLRGMRDGGTDFTQGSNASSTNLPLPSADAPESSDYYYGTFVPAQTVRFDRVAFQLTQGANATGDVGQAAIQAIVMPALSDGTPDLVTGGTSSLDQWMVHELPPAGSPAVHAFFNLPVIDPAPWTHGFWVFLDIQNYLPTTVVTDAVRVLHDSGTSGSTAVSTDQFATAPVTTGTVTLYLALIHSGPVPIIGDIAVSAHDHGDALGITGAVTGSNAAIRYNDGTADRFLVSGSGAITSGPSQATGAGSTPSVTAKKLAGQTGYLLNCVDDNNALKFSVAVDGECISTDDMIAFGTMNCHGGFAAWNHAIPGSQPAITGALSTVTDAAAKAVLTSIIAAMVGCGLATDGTS